MRLIIEPNYEQLSKWAANYVAAKIKKAILRQRNHLYWACLQALLPWACTRI